MSDKQRSGFVIGLSGFVKRSFCCLTGLTNLKQTLTNPKKPVGKDCIPNKPTVCQSGIKSVGKHCISMSGIKPQQTFGLSGNKNIVFDPDIPKGC